MSRKIIALIIFQLLIVGASIGQETNSEAEINKMQQQINLLTQQMALEKAKSDFSNRRLDQIKGGIPASSVQPLGSGTKYVEGENNFESISLSFEALREISEKISLEIKNDADRYSGIVLYNEPDFRFLARYRLYRNQARITLRNYDAVLETIRRLTNSPQLAASKSGGQFQIKSSDPLMTALAMPSIGTAYAKSVAELLSVFRSETTITQTTFAIDNASFGAVLANEIKKTNPNVKLYFPQAFVAEYNLDEEAEGSLFRQITKINAAAFVLNEVIAQITKLSEEENSSQDMKDALALAEIVRGQLTGLAITGASDNTGSEDETGGYSGFRQLIRAEKLDTFLSDNPVSTLGNLNTARSSNNKIGVLKLRVLSSGGSRREKKNLFLGNKTDFSGSVVVEVFLFDADGTLQKSDVFSLHTGFRKMNRQ